MQENDTQYLGDYVFEKRCFDDVEELFSQFSSDDFKKSPLYKQKELVNKKLYELIKSHASREFLFLEVIDFIHRVRDQNLVERYNLIDFELWLNQFSKLEPSENYYIRGLIAGKFIPRDDYQLLFPIGMGKTYEGSHIVTAHASPDLDTIVASFWGWMDAFSARVSKGLHIWNVPGGPPASHVEVEQLFYNIMGNHVFDYLSKSRSQLSLTSLDLMTQDDFVVRKKEDHSLNSATERSAGVVIVDDEGYYLGDWRSFDVESVRQVIMSLNSCIRWLESELRVQLITLFAEEAPGKDKVMSFAKESYCIKIKECEPFKEFTEKQVKLLDGYLKVVLRTEKGVEASFEEFSKALLELQIVDFTHFQRNLENLASSELFNQAGEFVENRPSLFHYLEKIVKELNEVFKSFRLYVDTLDIAHKVKTHVFGYEPQYLPHRTDVEEILTKMGSYPYLTVNMPAPNDKQIPVGIVKAADLKKRILGTATLRDFCNRDETKVPPYFEVISVIDHHKSSISTSSAPTATLTDAQSANAVVAQFAFAIHDKYSKSGMDEASVSTQFDERQKTAKTATDFRCLRNLLMKKEAYLQSKDYFVSDQRQVLEYTQYIFAILDDTDLLTKVSYRDVMSMKGLLNRLKTLILKKETEVVDFDDLKKDEKFVENAAKKLLQNKDLYSLYSKVYSKKEQVVEDNLKLCAEGKESNIFVDTKIQNGCARVGQTKIFAKNYPFFYDRKNQVRDLWFKESCQVIEDHPQIDLHMHMISTVASAEELFKGERDTYLHKDEMWIWIPETELAVEHLKYFLSVFKKSPKMISNDVELKFYGPRSKEFSTIFKESFVKTKETFSEEKLEASYAVIYYNAGSINSRKAAVSPYLPKVST